MTLEKLRRETELQHCPRCGEPLDILPCCRRHETLKEEMLRALKGMVKASDEIAAEFIQHKRATDWGVVNAAYLDAEAVIRGIEKKATR